jgi:predicted nucleic acid-binding protein
VSADFGGVEHPILLDTNFLICGLVEDSLESERLKQWYLSGRLLVTSSVAWYEFLCGPVNESQIEVIRAFLKGPKVIGFDQQIASRAALLFNQLGRSRKLRIDIMIAATAIETNAELATANIEDFKTLVPLGLKLWGHEVGVEGARRKS